jgi:hypothetical protein
VAINQLPCTEETLWLRLLGKGEIQKRAFEPKDPRRSTILKLLANWKVSIAITGQTEREKELTMALSQAYLDWGRETEQRG